MKYYVGVDLGVEKTVAGLVDKYGKLVHRVNRPTQKDQPFEAIMKDVYDLILELLDEEGIDMRSIKHIGVATPGVPNKAHGTILRNYSMNFVNAPVRDELMKYVNLPVYVENDANCAALAESVSGAAEDIDFSITLKIGHGLGGGIVSKGQIYSGFNGAASEMGHITIVKDGEQCICGRKGCWQMYSSASAFVSQIQYAARQNPESLINKLVDYDLTKVTEFTAFEAAKGLDPTAMAVCNKYIDYLADGLTNIINILMPEVVVISGEIRKVGEPLFKPLRAAVRERVYSREIQLPEIKVSELGSAAVVIGAALTGLNRDIFQKMLY